ncbi:hypothetical protein AC629_42595 [Bradyrhizobium sp. NAS80.1]|uniref:hypothetical protein n=1 Tax=Bradyrhizobium sp. NAS80.1 TaxID=1680159 RepID=UPI00095EC568|nr:hypothetical protein [Bradyrhizobium sp. NAS80.1]OKO67650.1 hypothetical protein AC629_42595 [Bradyrhizobium sp. NAS80.1]
MAYISVSIDVTSAANQIEPDAWGELFNALGERLEGEPERIVERMGRDVGDELDDNGKAFLKACRDYFNEQFPGE